MINILLYIFNIIISLSIFNIKIYLSIFDQNLTRNMQLSKGLYRNLMGFILLRIFFSIKFIIIVFL